MAPKIRNRPLRLDEVIANTARVVARDALQRWYLRGYERADALIPQLQINSNLCQVAILPGWLERKGLSNGYVMLVSLFNGYPRPMIVRLDFGSHPAGRLTGRQLHQQARLFLRLEPKHSLRMIPHRPWYRYIVDCSPVPERRAILANDAQCRYVLGTTLIYWLYV